MFIVALSEFAKSINYKLKQIKQHKCKVALVGSPIKAERNQGELCTNKLFRNIRAFILDMILQLFKFRRPINNHLRSLFKVSLHYQVLQSRVLDL